MPSNPLFALSLALLVAACASQPKRPPMTAKPAPSPAPAGVKIGKPYTVFGRTYVPADDRQYDERGIASWYGPTFHSKPTANGEIYNQDDVTAAHKTLPMPSWVEVENLDNGRKLTVRINDRGPFVGDRIIDLSYTAAHKLDMTRKGTALVEVRVIEPGDDAPPTLPLPIATATAATPPAPARAAASANARVDASTVIGVSSRFLQTGSFSARANAEAMQQRLANSGIRNTLVREAQIGDRTVFRVQVGPLDGPLEADDMIERLRIAGVPDARPAHE